MRQFTDELVSQATVFDILDDARFAPSGGNRQAWGVIVVDDTSIRRSLRDLYLDGWHDYMAHSLAGLIPFSPMATSADRAVAAAKRGDAEALSQPDGFAETLDKVPVLLVVTANLSLLAAVDRDLERYNIAGGASIYPFVWQIILAARDRGLGGVMTTMATRNEPQLRVLFGLPDNLAVAAVVALGVPRKTVTQLRRRPVESFTTIDHFDGPALTKDL